VKLAVALRIGALVDHRRFLHTGTLIEAGFMLRKGSFIAGPFTRILGKLVAISNRQIGVNPHPLSDYARDSFVR
jgi:hypothetical protein